MKINSYLYHLLILSLSLVIIIVPYISFAQSDTTIGNSIPNNNNKSLVYTLVIKGAIGAVTDMRIKAAVETAEDNNAELLIIMLDTPGGFTGATWLISKTILNSHVPVCVYIAPLGATAGSAGVYITYSAHFAAMAPTANIGAAHPVSGEGEIPDSVMNEKVTNDAVAKIRSSAEKWKRNADWAERAVRESVSITASEALDSNVVDIIASDIDDLLRQIDGRTVAMPTGNKEMTLSNTDIELIKETFVHRFLGVITNPNIVFILFSLGGLGLVMELYNPGAILPGVVGVFSLIIAFYASSVLPINYAGVALIMLAIVLFIAEIKIASAGLLTLGGVLSLFLGGVMLFDTVDPDLKVSTTLLVTVSLLVGVIAATVLWLVMKVSTRKPFIGKRGMLGKIAEVRGGGMVYVDGALWKMESSETLNAGEKVEITEVIDLKLKVKRLSNDRS